MRTFQLIAVPILAVLFARAVYRLLRGERPRWAMLLQSVVWASAAIGTLAPDMSTRIANALGINLGAHLVIYVVAVAFIVTTFYFYGRYRRLESEITDIARYLAVRDADEAVPGTRDQDVPTPEARPD